MFCSGVLACLGFAQIRADIVLMSAQEKLTFTKGEELMGLVLGVSPWCGNADSCVCWVWKAGMRGEAALRLS